MSQATASAHWARYQAIQHLRGLSMDMRLDDSARHAAAVLADTLTDIGTRQTGGALHWPRQIERIKELARKHLRGNPGGAALETFDVRVDTILDMIAFEAKEKP